MNGGGDVPLHGTLSDHPKKAEQAGQAGCLGLKYIEFLSNNYAVIELRYNLLVLCIF